MRLTSSFFVCMCLLSIALLAESAGGLRWTAPAGWKRGAAEQVRIAVYALAPTEGDKPGAECGVYFFGAGEGGSVQANIRRWSEQVHDAQGNTAVADVNRRTRNGLAMTTISSSGEYAAMGGPMVSKVPPQPNYQLLAAVIEGANGNLFVKCVGPAKTIAANRSKFDELLDSFQKE